MLLKTKLSNQLKRIAEEQKVPIDIYFNNISINGVKKGCSGFIVSKDSCVYVNTESPLFSCQVMYRLAKDTSDYSSNSLINGRNRWCKEDELAEKVINLLKTEKPRMR